MERCATCKVTRKAVANKKQARKNTKEAAQAAMIFHRQYQIYGQYVVQEERDIGRAIRRLESLARSSF